MLTTRPIRKRYGYYLCRRCMNREYKVHMKPADCRYRYAKLCPLCRSTDHVVVGFTLTGHYKMLLKY